MQNESTLNAIYLRDGVGLHVFVAAFVKTIHPFKDLFCTLSCSASTTGLCPRIQDTVETESATTRQMLEFCGRYSINEKRITITYLIVVGLTASPPPLR